MEWRFLSSLQSVNPKNKIKNEDSTKSNPNIMKTSQLPPPKSFSPVLLTLETQDEVDCMYAIFNTSPIARILEKHGVKKYPYELLEFYVDSKNTKQIFDELREKLADSYKK